LLHQTPVERLHHVPPDKRWYVLNSDSSLREALEVMREYQLGGLPVRDVRTNRCMGFIDVLDLVGYLVSMCLPAAELTLPALCQVFERFANTPISDVCDFSKRNPFVPIPVGQSVEGLLRSIKDYPTPVHRVPLVSGDRQNPLIVAIATQSDIAAYVAQHISVLGPRGQQPIRNIFRGFQKVVSVLPHNKAIDAFWVIHSQQISGVAIIDSQGRLVSNLSASDLKGVGSNQFHRLFMPVVDYIKEMYRDAKQIMTSPIVVTPDSSLENLILKFAAARVHRIYVVEAGGIVQGVITLTDLMKFFIAELNL